MARTHLGIAFILSLFLSVFCQARAQNFYQLKNLDSLGLNPQEISLLQTYLKTTTELLPRKIKTAFPAGIPLQFQPLREHLQGRAHREQGLILNQSEVLTAILKMDWHEAIGTLLHETAHLYDFFNLRSMTEKAFISECQMFSQGRDGALSQDCELIRNVRTTVSTEPLYLEIAGWPLSVQGNNQRKTQNLLSHRSVDNIELQNPYEHFASNFEHYILDPDYACRKPVLTEYFDRHFDMKKSRNDCAHQSYVDPSARRAEEVVKNLPLERVYQIHVLHAGPGSALMSNWGHTMFRVVICAPDRKEIGPQCMQDENHHLVLSFRAFVNTPTISSWKGLTGAYPSRLFFVPFEEVKTSYLDLEGRDLFSYPLRLNKNEQNLFLKRALEIHWSYDSRYYFVSNNCAIESLNLIKSVLMRTDLLSEKIVTPNELLRLLDRSRLLERPQGKPDQLLRQGFVFQSRLPHQVYALSLITGKKETLASLKEHFAKSFTERRSLYLTEGAGVEKLAAIVSLEEIAFNRFVTDLNEQLLNRAFNSVIEKAQEIRLSYMKSVEHFDQFSAPHEFIKTPLYGIPSQAELDSQALNTQKLWQTRQANDEERREILHSLFGDEKMNEKKALEEFVEETRALLFAKFAAQFQN